MKVPKFNVTEIAGLGAGGVGSSLVASKLLGSQNAIIQRAVPLAIGVVLTGMSNEFIKNVGRGFISGSAAGIVQDNIPGLQDDVMLGEDVLMSPDPSPYMGSSDSHDYDQNY